MIQSLCTIANSDSYDELLIMLRSVSLFAELNLYVAGDQEVVERLQRERLDNRLTTHRIQCRQDRVKHFDAAFMDLMLFKMEIMDVALSRDDNTLFADADMVFLDAPWGMESPGSDLWLSPHYILPEDEAKWGRFNAGYLFTGNRSFPGWWREAAPRSTYLDQQCLEEAPEHFRVQELSIHHNFGWWRLDQSDPKGKWWQLHRFRRPVRRERLSKIRVVEDRIEYDGQPLVSVHTHLLNRRKKVYQSTNRLVRRLLQESTSPKHKTILGWL